MEFIALYKKVSSHFKSSYRLTMYVYTDSIDAAKSIVSKGDLADYLFALSVELDCLCSSCPDGDSCVAIANLSDEVFNLSKNL